MYVWGNTRHGIRTRMRILSVAIAIAYYCDAIPLVVEQLGF